MGKSRINRGRSRKEENRERAEERARVRTGRSNSEQIALLNARLGDGVGAVRERRKLEGEGDSELKTESTKSSRSTRSARRKAKAARHRARKESET